MPAPSITRICLWSLALWATVLTLETWMRTPGSWTGRRLPPRQLHLDGAVYERAEGTDGRKVKELPSSAFLVRHWLLNYHRRSDGAVQGAAAAELQVADIEATGSGTANRLPIRRISQWMGGRAAGSRGCLMAQRDGTVQLVEMSPGGKRSLSVESPRSGPFTRLTWLIGLRPIEDVRCTWISSDRQLSGSALRQISSLVK